MAFASPQLLGFPMTKYCKVTKEKTKTEEKTTAEEKTMTEEKTSEVQIILSIVN